MTPLYERRLRRSRLFAKSTTILALRFFWVVVVIWCEFGIFFYSLSDCRWPDSVLLSETRSPSEVTPTRVLLLTDARLRNPAPSSLGSWFSYDPNLSYLRKSWRVASRLRPNVVIFLGDTFASGRYVASKTEYDKYYRAFETTFPRDSSVPFYLIPGNNDIGLGDASTFSEDARRLFEERFGPLNRAVSIAGHQFVLLNAPGLVEENYRRHAHGRTYDHWIPLPGGPIEFVKSISDQVDDHAAEPKILLSHIPLSRPSSKSCGPLREQGSIRTGAGLGYQTMLGKETTEFLLNMLRPSVVFSGDNRDYCEITHDLPGFDPEASMVREVTVKSFSPSRHIRRPGFQLLSLIPPSSSLTGHTFADTPCHLPDMQRVFHFICVPCLLSTALILLYVNISSRHHHRRFSHISLTRDGRSSPPPEPESAIWATRTPLKSRLPASPAVQLPLSTRVPSTKSIPSYRASPVSTPHGSPLLSPITLFPSGDERDVEDEYVGPSHYNLRREVLHHSGWQGEHDTDDDERGVTTVPDRLRHPNGRTATTAPYFSRAPPPSYQGRSRWSLSWTFTVPVRGRWRRMTVGIPDRRVWQSWLPGMGGGAAASMGRYGQGRERGLAWQFVRDCVSVALPAVVVWALIDWLFF